MDHLKRARKYEYPQRGIGELGACREGVGRDGALPVRI